MSLKREPSSEPLHIAAKLLFLTRAPYLCIIHFRAKREQLKRVWVLSKIEKGHLVLRDGRLSLFPLLEPLDDGWLKESDNGWLKAFDNRWLC